MLRLLATAALVLVLGVTWPTVSEGQVRPEESLTRPADSGLEVSLATRLGIPSGYVRVGEGPLRGTRLRLHDDLGIDVSEARGERGPPRDPAGCASSHVPLLLPRRRCARRPDG